MFDYTAVMEQLIATRDVKARFSALTVALEDAGFDQINYGFFDPAAAKKAEADVVFLSTMTSDWLEFYQDRDLHLTDPHVVKVRQGNLTPYFWGDDQVSRLNDAKMLDTALMTRDAGIGTALCIPMASPFDPLTPVAGMTLGRSERRAADARLSAEDVFGLIAVSQAFHALSLPSLTRERLGVRPLTCRERDCLTLVAEGWRHEAVADRLRLSRTTVELHLGNARRKLKARTLTEATARALIYGEIHL